MKIKIKDKVYDIEISELEEGKVKITVDGKEFIFGTETKEKEKISIAKTSLPKRYFEEKEIRAPIAGIISEIFVKENNLVKKGEKLLLLSAMKMENEIVSDFEGKVKKILVEREQKVKENEVLIILE